MKSKKDKQKTKFLLLLSIIVVLVALGCYTIKQNKKLTPDKTSIPNTNQAIYLENIGKTIQVPTRWTSPIFEAVDQKAPPCGTYITEALEKKVVLSIAMICPSVAEIWYEGLGTLSAQSTNALPQLHNTGEYNIFRDPEKFTQEIEGKMWRYYVYSKGIDGPDGHKLLVNGHETMVTILIEETVDPKTELELLTDSTIIFNSLREN